MKKTFLVSTEHGRLKGRISFYIAEISPTEGLRLIDNESTCSSRSNHGIINEALAILIKHNELPAKTLDYQGYCSGEYDDYILILCDGTGYIYVNQFKP